MLTDLLWLSVGTVVSPRGAATPQINYWPIEVMLGMIDKHFIFFTIVLALKTFSLSLICTLRK